MTDNSLIVNPHLEGGSFFWEAGPAGVLLLHGYTATTAEVRPLARALHERGYTIAGPLLPGHGSSPAEMNRCRWQAWAEAAEIACQRLMARCERVFVGGESMGAVLALDLASRYPQVAGILAYSPALRLPAPVALKARLAALFVATAPKRNLDQIGKRWQGYAVHPLRALVQLLRLQRAIRPRLPHIRRPLLIVQGRLDTVIDLRSVDILYRETNARPKELHWMEQSGHTVILDRELPQVAELTGRFIERVLLQKGVGSKE